MNALTLYGRNPFELLDDMFDSDRYFEPRFRSPAVDFREERDRYVLEAELPGLSEKDISIQLKDNVLTLSTSSEKEPAEQSEKFAWVRKERRSFKFSRSFSLPEDVDAERVEARFRDGLLTIDLLRKPESAPRLVPVKAA